MSDATEDAPEQEMATPGASAAATADAPFAPFRHGLRHQEVIATLAREMQPNCYFEIGTSFGKSLAAIDCPTICVDPVFRIETNVIGNKPSLMLFQQTSDDFFRTRNLSALLPPPGTIDLAFLDGMHHFEFLLRDFIHTERFCSPRSVVLLHDCLPVRPISARRTDKGRRIATETRRPVADRGGGWTGDVWKTLRILQTARPKLRITVFDCPPSSLVAVTNCDPQDDTLADRYYDLVATWMDADQRPGWFDALHDSQTLVSSRDHAEPEALLRVIRGR